MPPKNAKKQAIAKPDDSGIPKQDVQFKVKLGVRSDASELAYAVMFEWFGAVSDKVERNDTPLIEAWQKGEEGELVFEKSFDPIRVDDDFCKAICTRKFFVYFVNAENNQVEDSLLLDFSSLLMWKGEDVMPKAQFMTETIKVMGIDLFTITIEANKQLLQDMYRHYLNPLEVQVIGAKDVPIDSTSKYQPAYVRYSFFDGTQVETHPVVGRDKLIWNHKHVFLVGLIDPVQIKEKIRSSYMKFQLHDRDQLQNKKLKEDTPLFDLTKAIEEEMEKEKPVEDDPKKKGGKKEPEKKQVKKDAKKEGKKKDLKLGEPILPEKVDSFQNNYGIAAFYLVDYLKPAMRSAKYKAPVVPKNTFEDFQSRNIDLNTTARNQMQKIIASNNYFEQDTAMAVGFTLSYAIGSFVKPGENQPEKQQAKKQEQKPKEKKESAGSKDPFERVIYIIPYKDSENIQKIENLFYEANLTAFNLKNKREISTYLLKKEEKQNSTIDYLTGIELIDNDGRMYVLEGLKNGTIKKFHQIMVKSSMNTKQFKILQNKNLSFTRRLYSQFNLELKRIRFRPSLNQILLDPSIYIKSKVPQNISVNLNRISEIRKLCDDLKTVDSMNLWPSADILVQIERKFSDSLSYFDIHGIEEELKKKKASFIDQPKEQKNIVLMNDPDFKHVTMDQFSLPKISQNEPVGSGLSESMPNMGQTATKRYITTKTFMKDESKNVKSYDMQLKKSDFPNNQPVYIYGGQKNNWYEKQMKDIREKLINQKGKALYTYSKDYLGLTIDPKNLEQQMKKQKILAETMNYSKDKFSSVIIKTKEERMRLPKRPGDEDIEDMKRFPFHEQKMREKQMRKNTRDLPLNSQNKPEFNKYLRKPEYFSQPEVIEGEKIPPAQKQRLQHEQRKRIQKQSRQKMMGDPIMRIKKGHISEKATGLDKFQDIRQGEPVKKGIIDLHKKTKERRPIQQYQVSYELSQKRINPAFNPLVRKDESNLNTNEKEFNIYQRPEVLTKSELTKPLKHADF